MFNNDTYGVSKCYVAGEALRFAIDLHICFVTVLSALCMVLENGTGKRHGLLVAI